MFKFLAFLFLPLLILSAVVSVHGESISGEVFDPSHRPVSGVQMSLFQGQHSVAHTATDAAGHYRFIDLPPGEYQLFVKILGFAQEQKTLRLEKDQALREDVLLRLEMLREDILVTATRTETPTSLLGNSVSILTREEIEAQHATHVLELLRNTPGMNIVQTGGSGGTTSIFLRGSNSNYTKVYLDGIPLNQPGGTVDLSALSTAGVERIEIVRGPQSALYGSDAIGGVVQIFTRKKSEGAGKHPVVDFTLEGGSHHTGSVAASVGGAHRGFTYATEFLQSSTRNQDANGYLRRQSFSTHFGYVIRPGSTLDFYGRTERGRHGLPGPTAFGPADLDAYTRRRDYALGAVWQHDFSSAWRQRLSYSQAYTNDLSENPIDSGCFLPQYQGQTAAYPYCDYPYSSPIAAFRRTLNYQNDLFLSGHAISLGLEIEDERGDVESTSVHRINHGYYLQDQFLLLPRLAITGGVRLEKNESFGFAAVPRISAAYLLRGGSGLWGMSRAKFNYGLGIKEPSFLESFSRNFYYRGNADLQAEKSQSYEIGFEQDLAGDRIRLENNLFLNRFRNQIALQTVDPMTYEAAFFNIGRSQAWGWESVATARPIHSLQLSGGYTYLNTRVIDSTSPYNPLYRSGAPLLRRPAHSGSLQALWNLDKWTLQTDWNLLGRRADGDFYGLGLTSIGRSSRWDASVSYRCRPDVEVYTVVENLANRRYFEVLGYNAPRLQVRAGIRFRPWR